MADFKYVETFTDAPREGILQTGKECTSKRERERETENVIHRVNQAHPYL